LDINNGDFQRANFSAGRPLQSGWGPQISDPKHGFAPAPIIEKLPFNIEHSILCAMQRLMEESLFYWAKKWVPALLEREGWETPEAGELNRYLTLQPFPVTC
jgi:hypothetical protein